MIPEFQQYQRKWDVAHDKLFYLSYLEKIRATQLYVYVYV